MTTWEVSQLPVVDEGRCVGSLVEGSLMTRSLEDHSVLDRPVRDVMDDPLPVVGSNTPSDRLAPMLTRESPAALVEQDGALIGIVSRYDLLQQLIGGR